MTSRFSLFLTGLSTALAVAALPACSRHHHHPDGPQAAADSVPVPAQPNPAAPDPQPPQPPTPSAQAEAQAPAPTPPAGSAQNPPVALDPLEKLVSPIALYPDPLLALLLPASVNGDQINQASQYLTGGGDPSQVDNQPWDPSVRGLAHYPDVIEWMAQNKEWTQALGSAYTSRPADVMQAIQHLRSIARTAGTLTTTPQQQVVADDGEIAIEPAQPDVIYVPSYDPDAVFVAYPYGYYGPWLTFGVGFPVGIWLGYGLDWRRHEIWRGDWHNWYHNGGWGHPVFPGAHGFVAAPGARDWRQPGPAPAVRFDVAPGRRAETPREEFQPEHGHPVPTPSRMHRAPHGGERDRNRDRR